MIVVREEDKDPKTHTWVKEYICEEWFIDLVLRVRKLIMRDGSIVYHWEISEDYLTVELRYRWSFSSYKTFGEAYRDGMLVLLERMEKNTLYGKPIELSEDLT